MYELVSSIILPNTMHWKVGRKVDINIQAAAAGYAVILIKH